MTNDLGTDVKHLHTIAVAKDSAKPNGYIVSYIAPTQDPTCKPKEKKVVIYVRVVKENGKYKIDDAFGDAIKI